MTNEQAILKELINRFKRLDKAFDSATKFSCWSCAHSMADDARRVLKLLRKK